MKIYLATVRILNWLLVVTLSIIGMLWFAGSVSIPPHFAPGRDAAPAESPAQPAPAVQPAQPAATVPPPVQPAATVPPPVQPSAPATPAAVAVPAAAPAQQQAQAPVPDQPAGQVPTVVQGGQEPDGAAADVGGAGARQPKPTLKNAKRTALITALVMLGLNIGSVVVKLRGSSRARYLIFEKEGAGSLKIAVDAIEDTLMKCAAQIPEIQYSDIRMVLEKGGKMPRRAIAHCIFTDVPNLFVVQDNVRQILTSRYQEIFPNETLMFDIVVDRLKAEHEPERRKKTDEETRFRGDEFFGPKYPVQR